MRKGRVMSIIFHESSKTFHLYNNNISYIMTVLPNGHLGNLYFGKRIHDREDFSYLLEMKQRPMTACVYEGNRKFSLEHLKLEYPVYGSSDYRYPAVEILQENGSRISDFTYVSYTIAAGPITEIRSCKSQHTDHSERNSQIQQIRTKLSPPRLRPVGNNPDYRVERRVPNTSDEKHRAHHCCRHAKHIRIKYHQIGAKQFPEHGRSHITETIAYLFPNPYHKVCISFRFLSICFFSVSTEVEVKRPSAGVFIQ